MKRPFRKVCNPAAVAAAAAAHANCLLVCVREKSAFFSLFTLLLFVCTWPPQSRGKKSPGQIPSDLVFLPPFS